MSPPCVLPDRKSVHFGGFQVPACSLPLPTTIVWFQAPRGSDYHFGLEEWGHPEVALAMTMDVEEVDGAKDPEVHGGRPDPYCFQGA